jgi:hypothetical protein
LGVNVKRILPARYAQRVRAFFIFEREST